MIKGIVFDMDGLMFDTGRLVIMAWKFAGLQMGLNITDDLVIMTLGLNKIQKRSLKSSLKASIFMLCER